MTIEKAIEHFNNIAGLDLQIDQRPYWPEDCKVAIANILETAEMVERAGGELRSRQAIAVIIQLSKLEAKLLS